MNISKATYRAKETRTIQVSDAYNRWVTTIETDSGYLHFGGTPIDFDDIDKLEDAVRESPGFSPNNWTVEEWRGGQMVSSTAWRNCFSI